MLGTLFLFSGRCARLPYFLTWTMLYVFGGLMFVALLIPGDVWAFLGSAIVHEVNGGTGPIPDAPVTIDGSLGVGAIACLVAWVWITASVLWTRINDMPQAAQPWITILRVLCVALALASLIQIWWWYNPDLTLAARPAYLTAAVIVSLAGPVSFLAAVLIPSDPEDNRYGPARRTSQLPASGSNGSPW